MSSRLAQILHAFSGAAAQHWLAAPRPAGVGRPTLRYTLARDADPVIAAVLGDMAADGI
jgi:hypothetical protein